MKAQLLVATLLLGATSGAVAQAVKVEVASEEGRHRLLRGGVPYVVKGVGIGNVDFGTVSARGGNSVRTWGIDMALAKLDAAERHGLTVAMGLPVAPPRLGFDYADEAAVMAQRADVLGAVWRYRDHPALLTWIIGNELDQDAPDLRVYDEVNALAQSIRATDPDHPVTTTVTGGAIDTLPEIVRRTPDLDFYGLQLYGALAVLPDYVEKLGGRPFMVTEWGPLGHWEVGRTAWDAPVEQTSEEKAVRYLEGYAQIQAAALGSGLGAYVFLWGQKQERTPTWYSMFTPSGESTAAVDAMQRAWTGTGPNNRAPMLVSALLDGKSAHESVTLRPGLRYPVSAAVDDPDGDALTYRWHVKRESTATAVGGDWESALADLPGLIENPFGRRTVLRAPNELGAYRLFVFAYDGKGHAAHANIPFLVRHRRQR